MLALAEAFFPKRGPESAGVALQYNRAVGRHENCQVGEFVAYASPRGRDFIDRALYLPKKWASDRARLAGVGVPEGVGYATKGELALGMLGRAFGAGVPAAWVTSDNERYADDGRLPRWLEELGRSYVLATAHPERESLAAEDRYARMPERHWERVEARAGGEGACLYEWARRRLPYGTVGGRAPWLLIRRSAKGAAGGFVYYRALGSQETPLAELARVARTGEAVEEDLDRARGEVGLDQYEVRHWKAWHRHVTLCLLAHAALQVATAGAEEDGEVARHGLRLQ